MDCYIEPHMDRSALIIVDAQRAFTTTGAVGREEKLKTIPFIKDVVELYRQEKSPIVHVVRIYLPDGSNVDMCRRTKITSEGTDLSPEKRLFYPVDDLLSGVELDSKLLMKKKPQFISDREAVIYKPRFSSFYETCLMDYLKSFEVDTLIVTGFNYPNCPRATIYDGLDRDFRIVVPEGAISHMTKMDRKQLEAIGVSFLPVQDLRIY